MPKETRRTCRSDRGAPRFPVQATGGERDSFRPAESGVTVTSCAEWAGRERKQEPSTNLRTCWWWEKPGERGAGRGGFDFWPWEEWRSWGREQGAERPIQKAE